VDTKPGQREIDIFAIYKGELKDFESPDDHGTEYLKIERDTRKSRGIFGLGENFLLTFSFKDALQHDIFAGAYMSMSSIS